jgi:alpha-tubulin suppressor-like RCC1 family protein
MGSNACGQLGLKLTKRLTHISSSTIGESGAEDQDADINHNRFFEPMPVTIKGLGDQKITKVACGEQHTLALTIRGQVYSWG